ncbi:hypothetical protein, partial [Agromyces neolithicus]|uniref:hypothetical protein n=1 Tax=Agromyces neolithicus TaxID=269420 RepID=UPI0031D5C9B6
MDRDARVSARRQMSTHNFETLRSAVIDASRSNRWAQAVEEWQVVGVEEDPQGAGVCTCGKTGLVYLYTIHNRHTDQVLFPIGSSCVNLFEVEELDISIAVLRRLFDLRAAYATGKRVTLTNEFFSRAVLADLWQNGAFPPNEYNRSNGDNDYRFLLDLFNQHHEFTEKEGRKVWVLLNRTIRSFV